MSDGNGQLRAVRRQPSTPSGVPTEVDIDSLAATIPWLEGLKNYVQTTLMNEVARMAITGNQATVIFGDFQGAKAVSGKHLTYMRSAIESYRAIAKSLDVATRATKDIVQNYKDAEHNNSLTMQKVDTTFATQSAPGHASSSPAASTSTTGTDNGDGGAIQA